jgi:uncharacterized membrane protein
VYVHVSILSLSLIIRQYTPLWRNDWLHMHPYPCNNTPVCMYVCVYVCMCVCMCACTHAYMRRYARAHAAPRMHTYICMSASYCPLFFFFFFFFFFLFLFRFLWKKRLLIQKFMYPENNSFFCFFRAKQ